MFPATSSKRSGRARRLTAAASRPSIACCSRRSCGRRAAPSESGPVDCAPPQGAASKVSRPRSSAPSARDGEHRHRRIRGAQIGARRVGSGRGRCASRRRIDRAVLVAPRGRQRVVAPFGPRRRPTSGSASCSTRRSRRSGSRRTSSARRASPPSSPIRSLTAFIWRGPCASAPVSSQPISASTPRSPIIRPLREPCGFWFLLDRSPASTHMHCASSFETALRASSGRGSTSSAAVASRASAENRRSAPPSARGTAPAYGRDPGTARASAPRPRSC